jgi:hypothetical protein
MNNEEIRYIKRCITTPIAYQYSKDTAAKQLLAMSIDGATKIGAIKQSRLGYLLNRPGIKQCIAALGNGYLTPEHLKEDWTKETIVLSLTLSQWGILNAKKKHCAYYQVSRPQKSLVLQVNLGGEHDSFFYTYFKKKQDRAYFSHHLHAGHARKNSLGWIRIDLNLDDGEALIEELQTDWMKAVFEMHKALNSNVHSHYLVEHKPYASKVYVDYMLKRYKKWDEMLLSAAVYFLKNELGLDTIWYHTFESGRFYKMMPDYSLPPRSLYTKLPQKMGFEMATEIPKILQECKELQRMNRAAKDLKFFKLQFKKQ